MDEGPLKGSGGFFGRRNRVRVLPWIIGYLVLTELPEFRVKHPLWAARIFFAGLAALLYCQWRLDQADLAHLAAEEAASREDPKHLFNSDIGFAYNRTWRERMAWCLIVMGSAVTFLAFQTFSFAFIFWGVGLAMAGVIIFMIF